MGLFCLEVLLVDINAVEVWFKKKMAMFFTDNSLNDFFHKKFNNCSRKNLQ